LSDRFRLVQYLQGEFPSHERFFQTADSLLNAARRLDPFVHRGLEQLVMVAYIAQVARQETPAGHMVRNYSDAEVTYYLDSNLSFFDGRARGLLAYSRGRYAEALRYWATAARTFRAP